MGIGVLAGRCLAQEAPIAPYAAIDRDAVSYNGPGRDAGHDLPGPEIRLGLLAPLSGPRQGEGEALRGAAEIAIEEENATSLPGRRRLALVTRDESGPWGRASNEIVHMVFDDQAVAIITSTDGGAAHLAEQVANKIGVPVLTLSTDTTTTEINLSWIFRLGPTDAAQAQAFARDIYETRKLRSVVLFTQNDHDGREGGDAFEKAVRDLHGPAPTRLTVEPERPALDAGSRDPANAQAVVIWSDAATATRLVARAREVLPTAPIYLCRKATQGNRSDLTRPRCRACALEDPALWTAETQADTGDPRETFEQSYHQRFGAEPSIAAAQAYDAMRVLAASLRQSGPNRARLRDALAEVSGFKGVSGIISFDHAGNDTSRVTLVRLR